MGINESKQTISKVEEKNITGATTPTETKEKKEEDSK